MKRGTKSLLWIIAATILSGLGLVYWDMPNEEVGLDLSSEEFEWLEEHGHKIRYAPIPDARTIDYVDSDGNHLGLTSEYVQLIERQLGIQFVPVLCDSWTDILEKLQNKEVDLAGSVQNRAERRDYLRFTEPYQDIKNVITMRKGQDRAYSLEDLTGMRIAVVEGSANHQYIAERFPEYTIVPVKEPGQGFRMVSFEQVEAMVSDIGAASYHITDKGMSNLGIAGDIDYPWELCFASRKDWPLLNSMLNKALANIPPIQRRSIYVKWIPIDYRHAIPREKYLLVIGIILIITLLAIGSVMFWNQTLRKQMSHRTRELGQVKQSHAQATKALGKSEERFRVLVESSNDMIWEMDQFGNYSYVSPRVHDILGYSPEELNGKNSLSLMIPQDSARNMAALRNCTVETTIHCEINTYFHKRGHRVILESSGKAFEDNIGGLAGFRGVSRDITERIENENALRQSEERFRNLVETTSDWIWEVDTNGHYKYTSPQANDLLGYSSAELLGRHFTELMPPPEAKAVQSLFSEIMERGTPVHSLVNTNRHKDGRTVVLETSAVPFYDKDWNIQGYRGIGRDITDRVAAEKQLEFERNLFRSFMEHAPDLIYFKDAEGRFIEVNDAKANELNLIPEDLIGRNDFDFMPEEQAQQRLDDELEIMRTKKPVQKEEQASTPNGTRWYLTTKVPRYNEEGSVVGTFGTSWDITHRKLAEEQLRQLRALLSNTIDSMPSILVGVDAHGTVIQWNRQAEAKTGHLSKDALGQPLHELFPMLNKEMVKVERAIRERTAQTEERIPVSENGRTRYIDITVYPLLDGQTEGAVIRVDDVTDRVMIEDSIRNIVEGVAAVGRRFFSSMVDQLAKTLDADFTFISEFADEGKDSMRTIAVSNHGKTTTNFDFSLAQTPSELVLESDACTYVENVKERFPDTELLHTLEIESYIGIPLVNSENKALGVMVALYRKPLEQVDFATSIMQVFAGRTAAELERLHPCLQFWSAWMQKDMWCNGTGRRKRLPALSQAAHTASCSNAFSRTLETR
jgi:PAS domain S-box-containing protein